MTAAKPHASAKYSAHWVAINEISSSVRIGGNAIAPVKAGGPGGAESATHAPCNYGYVPQPLSDDGDPVDVLVITPFPLTPSVVVTCRPIGVLMMDDEAGGDAKLLAVPIDKILPIYTHWQKPEDINPMRLKAITHFFEHYKDLEAGKWVKVKGWEGPDSAKAEVTTGIARYQAAK